MLKYFGYIAAALALVALGYCLAPEKRIIEEKVVHRDVITKIIERQLPDGSTLIETEILDRSKENSRTDTIPAPRTTLLITGMAGLDLRSRDLVYGAAVQRQLLGPVWIGAYGLTNGTVGMSVSLSF